MGTSFCINTIFRPMFHMQRTNLRNTLKIWGNINMADIILRDSDILSKEFSFKDKISVATEVATTLTEVIQTQGLAVNIQGNNYVTAEGWNCLGTMLGTYAQTEYVEPIKNPNGYKARVSIKQGENVLATAEAIATYGGFQKTPQAVYSMAQTRAMGKAYRMCFSWIVKLAGFQPTPAEEMEHPTFNDTYTVEHNVSENLSFSTAADLPNVESFVQQLIQQLKDNELPVTKQNIIKSSWAEVQNNTIDKTFHHEVVSWCKVNCPEDHKEEMEV